MRGGVKLKFKKMITAISSTNVKNDKLKIQEAFSG